jgi:signal peptidase I
MERNVIDLTPKKEEQEVVKEKPQKPFKDSLWEFVKFLLIAAIIVIPIRIWVAQPFIVSGSSMVPSFENGEYLIVDEFSYHFREPQRGEVVIFRYPKDQSKFFIKRIIGLPNERISIKDNKIFIFNEEFPGGISIEESYIGDDIYMANLNATLDENQYFVLGDNRKMSSDSRFWGPLEERLIIGRAWLRLWPFSKLGILP